MANMKLMLEYQKHGLKNHFWHIQGPSALFEYSFTTDDLTARRR